MAIEEYKEGHLVVVWNADAGWQHAMMDSLHKVLSPQTYSCKLCQLTHGIAGPKARWSKFIKTTERPVEFYHRDEFAGTPITEQLPGLELPVVLSYASDSWMILLSHKEIMQFSDLEALISGLKEKIS